jgi:hypothetical protein
MGMFQGARSPEKSYRGFARICVDFGDLAQASKRLALAGKT